MMETEWLGCVDPLKMLAFQQGRASERQLRLLACGCCRLVWKELTTKRSRRAVEIGELYADNVAVEPERVRVEFLAAQAASEIAPKQMAGFNFRYIGASRSTEEARRSMAREAVAESDRFHAERIRFLYRDGEFGLEGVSLIRDIFGNPFRLASVDPSWLTSTVVQLAQGIYEDRAFDRLPILADALQDAGCDNVDILDHCRGQGPHVQGCWVVDIILSKS